MDAAPSFQCNPDVTSLIGGSESVSCFPSVSCSASSSVAFATPPLAWTPFSPPPAPSWRSRREYENYLRSLCERLLGGSPVSLESRLSELCSESVTGEFVLAEICRGTGHSLDLGRLPQEPTLRELARIVDAAAWSSPVPLVQLRAGTGRPLFLMHSLAGNFLELWAVLRGLETSRPVHGLQARGLAAGQKPHLRIEDMAHDHIVQMRRVQATGPYAIGGYSFGGLIAFEVAQQLVRAGETVELLSLIDTHVHGRYLPLRQWANHRLLRIESTLRTLRSLSPPGRIAYLRKIAFVLVDRARALIGVEPVRPELVGDVVREANFPAALRRVRGAMLFAFRCYRPQPYAGKLIFLRASIPGNSDPLPVWRKLVRGGLEVSTTPGNHDEMISGANAKTLAMTLSRFL
ncbi:MAG: thioesterase domain-containing protein [Rhizobacter sp.]